MRRRLRLQRLLLVAMLAAGVALAAATLFLRGTLAPAAPGRPGPGAAKPAAGATAPVAAAVEPAPVPRSLRGTEPDGELVVDANGRFLPTRSALRFFDYFLTATGEEPPDAIRRRIIAAIEARLPPAAAREAEAFLDRYLAYRTAAQALASDPALARSADLERRLQWLRELRRAHFGAELAGTLFGEEEDATEVALEMRQVLADPSLDDADRKARLDELESELPEPMRRARAEARAPLALRQDEAALRAAGGTDGDVQALREARFGPEAAARLAALDRQRAAWNARLDAWRAERDRILADPDLDAASRAAALDAARAARFTGPEATRVRALDEAAAQATPPAAASPP
jgi:lipase chaperone LimK